jgi:hypothetical protein
LVAQELGLSVHSSADKTHLRPRGDVTNATVAFVAFVAIQTGSLSERSTAT